MRQSVFVFSSIGRLDARLVGVRRTNVVLEYVKSTCSYCGPWGQLYLCFMLVQMSHVVGSGLVQLSFFKSRCTHTVYSYSFARVNLTKLHFRQGDAK